MVISLSLTQFLGLGFISFFFNGVFNLRPISNYRSSSSSSCWVFREAQFGFYFLQSVFLWTQNDSVLPEAKCEEGGVERSERESGWDRFGDDEFGDGRRAYAALNMRMGPHGEQSPPLRRGFDIIPLSLGLETLGGVMTKIIPRNTTLPTSKSELFSTATDGQTNVKITVFIGEREFAWDNKYVCSFILNIPPTPHGVPQIEVKFCINSDGILSVTAVDKGTGEKQGIGNINLPNRKSIRRMVNEAERFAKDYKEKRDAIDTKNQAESVIYQTEKQLKELGEMRFLPQRKGYNFV